MAVLRRKFQEKPWVRVSVEVSPLCAVVMSDPIRIQQILFNFISNALKFTEVGSITIRARKLRDAVRISVTDTGRGIPAAEQELLFQPFKQVSFSDSSRFGGVGLGLYLVKLVGDLIGGRVGLESSLGLGSVFYLDLPLSVVPTELQSDMTDSTGNLESAILGSMSIEVKKKSTGIH